MADMRTSCGHEEEEVDVHAFLHQMGLDGEQSEYGLREEAPPLSHRLHWSIMEEREGEFEGESDTDDNEEGDVEYSTDMSAIDDGHCLMEDNEFALLMEAIQKKNGARQEAAALRLEARRKAEREEREELTSPESCQSVFEFKCPKCFINCALPLLASCASREECFRFVQNKRINTARYKLGNGERGDYVASLIKETSTTQATTHVSKRLNTGGVPVPANSVHYVVNGVDVCRYFYAIVLGVSNNMIETASADARAELNGRPRKPRQSSALTATGKRLGTATEHEAFDSPAVFQTVAWVIRHARQSGAELMPMAEFSKMNTVEDVYDAMLGAGSLVGLGSHYDCQVDG